MSYLVELNCYDFYGSYLLFEPVDISRIFEISSTIFESLNNDDSKESDTRDNNRKRKRNNNKRLDMV